MATTLFDFKEIKPSGITYIGILNDNSVVSIEQILTSINDKLNDDVTTIKIFVNNIILIEFIKSEVKYVNELVKNRTWFCKIIYNILNEPNYNNQFYITYQHSVYVNIIVYELMKYASMMSQSMKISYE